ncbi:hypothetical protein TRAPUB_2744 [Trametes pubescens]|uniref:Uncharacterized protein n=1 Tax=Trametes pubescens TaxID=154538 RepID=A0A1M2VFR8_TRAPU|nr:hypothetical protein TRAPUB_2744 [Trametes pubescens]
MAFNNRFDGLDLTPRFTFPEYQADANSNVPVTASQDSVAQPRQPDPLGGHSHLPNNDDSQELPGAASPSTGNEERLQEMQIVASPSASSLTRPSDLAGPSSSPANHLPVLPAADGSAAPRSRGKVFTAVAGPSRLVPIAPRAATVEAEVPTVPELRRSSRKRTSPTADHAEAAVHPPPPPKKRRVTNGVASNARQPAAVAVAVSTSAEEGSVAGPSRQTSKGAARPPAAKLTTKARPAAARAKKGTQDKRPRRTRENVDKHKEADMPSHPCDVVGCSKVWNPYTHDENRRHLQGHFDAGDLESDVDLVCVFDVCQEDVPGKDLLKHMEEDHIGLPYLCPIRCGWRSSRSSYQTQHMHREHKGVSWET